MPSMTPEAAGDESNPALVALIREEIAARGPLPFARFMELALAHPVHGYYATGPRLGRGGDFVTSPEMHAAFGGCLARQAAEIWRALGQPTPFTALEWGAGSGALARDLLRAARREPDFAAALEYAIHDVSQAMIDQQRRTLAEADLAARWTDVAAPSIGLVLANEVLDALPVHRLIQEHGEPRELLVTWQDDAFAETPGPLSTPALAAYLADGGIQLAEGQIVEVNLAALAWLDAVAARLERGAILIIDYGDTTEALYSPRRRQGTLLCYHQQTVNAEPFARIGRQDITAHVDFGALMRRAEQRGLIVAGLTTQGPFLAGLGLGEALLDLPGRVTTVEYLWHRQLIADLIRPDRLGGFRVLILTRALPPHLALAGLSVRF